MKRLFAGLGVIVFVILLATAHQAFAQTGSTLAATLLSSAARTAATVNTADQTNAQWSRVHIIINVSARTSGTYTPHIQAKDPVSGNYYDLLVGAGISATGTNVLKVGAGFVPLTNASSGDMLPRVWRVSLIGTSTPSMTFSVGAFLD